MDEDDIYFVIRVSEDGDVSASALSGETLRRRLRENYWGDAVFLPHIQPEDTLFDLLAQSGIRIIAGKQITPTPATVVTEWDL